MDSREGNDSEEDTQSPPEEDSRVELPESNCTKYCAHVDFSCPEFSPHAQYTNVFECVTHCEEGTGWPKGTVSETPENTIGCRLHHALAAEDAAADKAMLCDIAGHSGGGVCGSWCDNYCALAMENCTGIKAIYSDMETCMTTCATFDTSGSPGDSHGDTLQCRLFYLHLAGGENPAPLVQCPRAKADSIICVEPEPAPGDTCSDAIVVDPTALPFSHANDSSRYSNQYSTAGACTIDAWRGIVQSDVVYQFTPTETGSYQVGLSDNAIPGGPTIIYISTDCEDMANSCMEYSGDLFGGKSFEVTLEQGATYFLLVDGLLWPDVGPFTFTLSQI